MKEVSFVAIGWRAVSSQTPIGCNRLPLHDTTGRVFSGVLCTFIRRYNFGNGSVHSLVFFRMNFFSVVDRVFRCL